MRGAASGKLSLSTDADGFADFTVTLNVEQTVVNGPTRLAADDFLI
jgi:hypothetical protein